MSDRKLRWGVLSTANIGKKAVNPAIQASGNGELVAVASRDAKRAQAFAAEAGIPTSYGSYEELLADESIDAIYNPLPNSLHKAWTIKAAEAGKHILCEKPLTVSAAESREMASAASGAGVKLMEGFMYRFHPRTIQALDMLHGGAIGDIKQIRSSFTFKLDRPNDIRWDLDLGGGALLDLGCYCVNMSRIVAGEEPAEVRAMANFGESGVDKQMAGSMRFESGLLAHFDCALTMDRTEVCHILGSDGHLRVLDAFCPDTDDQVIEQFDAEDNLTPHTVAGDDQYQLMVEHFADCVLNDKDLRLDPSDAALNMAVIEALLESAKQEGEIVAVSG